VHCALCTPAPQRPPVARPMQLERPTRATWGRPQLVGLWATLTDYYSYYCCQSAGLLSRVAGGKLASHQNANRRLCGSSLVVISRAASRAEMVARIYLFLELCLAGDLLLATVVNRQADLICLVCSFPVQLMLVLVVVVHKNSNSNSCTVWRVL